MNLCDFQFISSGWVEGCTVGHTEMQYSFHNKILFVCLCLFIWGEVARTKDGFEGVGG